jgi:hypothetical protein
MERMKVRDGDVEWLVKALPISAPEARALLEVGERRQIRAAVKRFGERLTRQERGRVAYTINQLRFLAPRRLG